MGLLQEKAKKLSERFDLIVPLPVTEGRLRERGFNQTYILSEEIAHMTDKPIGCRTLVKTKETKDQYTLGREARTKNLIGVFAVRNPEGIKGRRILLVDDSLPPAPRHPRLPRPFCGPRLPGSRCLPWREHPDEATYYHTLPCAAGILLAGVVAWWRLPSIAIFLMGRAMGGRIEARHSTVSWTGRIATVELNDVSLSGDVQGTVKKVRLDVKPGRGIYIKYGLVSDFDVVIKKEKTGARFLPFQIERAEVTRGRAVYKGQTFTINSIKISNFNTSGQFEFSLDGGIEGFGKIKTHGGGIWRNGRSDISGTIPDSRLRSRPSFSPV